MADIDGTWRFSGIDGADVAALGTHAPWLTFDGDGQVYGMAGVNRVRGTWTLEDDVLTFGPMASTLMAGLSEASAVEQAVLALVGRALTVAALDDDTRLLTAGDAAATLVRYDPADEG